MVRAEVRRSRVAAGGAPGQVRATHTGLSPLAPAAGPRLRGMLRSTVQITSRIAIAAHVVRLGGGGTVAPLPTCAVVSDASRPTAST